MLARAIEFCGYKCFRRPWAGFSTAARFTVIIGRNNSGKSHLLRLAEFACDQTVASHTFERLRCADVSLTEHGLRACFPHGTSLQELSGDPWNDHGRRLIGTVVDVELGPGDELKIGVSNEVIGKDLPREGLQPRHFERIANARRARLERSLNRAALKTPLAGFAFRRLLAERDIAPEVADSRSTEILPDGRGATNVFRRFLSSAADQFDRSLIRADLLKALNDIFAKDGAFFDIVVRQHESQDGQPWEIYLEQQHKGLVPLGSSGSGLKTVLLVLLNLLVVPRLGHQERPGSNYVFAFEELENNLHPALLRRLLHYVAAKIRETEATLFVTTHSNVVLDFFAGDRDAQIVQVIHDGESAHTRQISAHFDRLGVIADLGARASDLLQANGIVWVEGPSDRIYLNRWIELVSKNDLKEGRDYQCAFYGGALLGRTQLKAPEEADAELVNLTAVNPNIVIVADRDHPDSDLKPRLQRITCEAKATGTPVWITEGLEIENYLPAAALIAALGLNLSKDPEARQPFFPRSCRNRSRAKALSYLASAGVATAPDKVQLALRVAPHLTLENMQPRLNWLAETERLVERIRSWRRQ